MTSPRTRQALKVPEEWFHQEEAMNVARRRRSPTYRFSGHGTETAAAVGSPPSDVRSRLIAQSPTQVGRIGNQRPVPAAFEKIEHRFDLRSHAAAGKLALGKIATRFFETHAIEPAL